MAARLRCNLVEEFPIQSEISLQSWMMGRAPTLLYDGDPGGDGILYMYVDHEWRREGTNYVKSDTTARPIQKRGGRSGL